MNPGNETVPLFCHVGDVVELKEDGVTTPWPDEEAEKIYKGTRYVVTALVGSGWDLQKIQGSGPEQLRILNSDMNKYVVLIK